MFKAIVLLIVLLASGQKEEATLVSHAAYPSKEACETALNGDVSTAGSAKKLIVDLAAQGITATVKEQKCVLVDPPGHTGE